MAQPPEPPQAKAGGSLGLKEAEFSQSLERGHCRSSGEQGQHSDCGESGRTSQQRGCDERWGREG